MTTNMRESLSYIPFDNIKFFSNINRHITKTELRHQYTQDDIIELISKCIVLIKDKCVQTISTNSSSIFCVLFKSYVN